LNFCEKFNSCTPLIKKCTAMLRKILPSAILMAGSFVAYAQDSTQTTLSKPVISGYVDVYYRYNLDDPSPKAGVFNNYTSFTNAHNSFELGMASVKLEYNTGKVGVVADLGFGRRAEEFSYNDGGSRLALKQAYLTYSPWSPVKITAGSWATHIGYELVDPYANRNYSMSYMFSYGPFFHTGVKADFTFGRSGFMVGLANPADLKSASFSEKHLLAQYSYTSASEKLKAYLNFNGGKPSDSTKRHQLDLVLLSTLSEKISVGYNGTIAFTKERFNGKFTDSENWWGSALYLNVDPRDWFGLSLRGEYFNDENAVSAGAFGAHIFATTLSANFKVGGLTFIPELRVDRANKELFTDNSETPGKTTTSALIAAVYKF
jgi:hypothetical protein